MGTDDKIGNGNGREWETTCMGMGMALIPMGINFHWLMQLTVPFVMALVVVVALVVIVIGLVIVVVADMTIMLLMTYLRLMTILFYTGTLIFNDKRSMILYVKLVYFRQPKMLCCND